MCKFECEALELPFIYLFIKKQNPMKKAIIIITTIIATSCANVDNSEDKIIHDQGRIKFIDFKSEGAIDLHIIEIDGQEYLVSYRGGIIKL